jgi:hypothetical protein
MSRNSGDGAVGGGIYGLAFIGALVYYFQHANTLSAFILGFIKALVWPAMGLSLNEPEALTQTF